MSPRHRAFATLSLISIGIAFGSQATKDQKVKIPAHIPKQAEDQVRISPEGSSDWHKSAANARKLIADCDAWLVSLRAVSAETRFFFAFGEAGRFGVTRGQVAIVDQRKFRAVFGHIGNAHGKFSGYHEGYLVADGSKFQRYDETGFSKPVPVSTPRLPKALLTEWVEHDQELVFAGFGTKDRPLTALLDAAKAAGFHSLTEHRSLSANGLKFSEDRVVLSGIATVSGHKAHLETEILIDHPTGALLKITELRRFGTRTSDQFRSYWTVKWDRHPGQVFDPTLFFITEVGSPATGPSSRS